MKLGILDVAGRIEQALELAPLVERLGYTRYWIAEHQPQPSPVLVAAIVAGQTTRIRVGTAGVLLHYRAPLATAHDFRFLERVFSDRIDAGFCGGMIPDAALIEADRDGRDLEEAIRAYPDRVARFTRYIREPNDSPLAWPLGTDQPPQLWSLGGGGRSAELAARHGLSFGYSLLYGASVDDPTHLRTYRERFVPHPDLAGPAAVLAVCGVCADTDAQAQTLAAPLDRGFFVPRIVGSAETCARQLRELARRYDVDEVVFADLVFDLDVRMRCHELLASAVLARGA